VQSGSVEVAGQLDASPAGHHQRHAAGSTDGNGIGLRRQLDADPAWRRWVLSGRALPLPRQAGAGERTAVQVILLTERLQAEAAPQVLFHQPTYFGTTAALTSCIDSFAAHAFRSASNPRFVKDAVGLTLMVVQGRCIELARGRTLNRAGTRMPAVGHTPATRCLRKP
jgi:hypothetical protein